MVFLKKFVRFSQVVKIVDKLLPILLQVTKKQVANILIEKGRDCGQNMSSLCDQICTLNEASEKGYECSCGEKFELDKDGRTCVDFNECNYRDANNCSEKEECKNIKGGYECTCKEGYEKVKNKCEDIDECHPEFHKCDLNAKCTNNEGGFRCTCNEYYTGDGFLCRETIPVPPTNDLCKEKTSCGINTICTKVETGRMCTCKNFHYGNPEHGCVFKSPAETWTLEGSLTIPLSFPIALHYNYSLTYASFMHEIKTLMDSMIFQKYIDFQWFSYEIKKIRFDLKIQ